MVIGANRYKEIPDECSPFHCPKRRIKPKDFFQKRKLYTQIPDHGLSWWVVLWPKELDQSKSNDVIKLLNQCFSTGNLSVHRSYGDLQSYVVKPWFVKVQNLFNPSVTVRMYAKMYVDVKTFVTSSFISNYIGKRTCFQSNDFVLIKGVDSIVSTDKME